MNLPILHLKKHEERRLMSGHLWVFSNEADTVQSPLNAFAPGDTALVMSARGKPLGVGYVNPGSLILARILDKNPKARPDRSWLAGRLAQALSLREAFFGKPYYRLVHGEGDHLPGLVVDRFGDVLCVQILTAGMERMRNSILDILDGMLKPSSILLKGDVRARELEGLPLSVEAAKGSPPEQIDIPEGPGRYRANLAGGQKTGWYYDQRPNRLGLLPLCAGKRVLDVYCYVGALGVGAALSGAASVVCVDASRPALDMAQDNAKANGVEARFTAIKGDAADVLESLAQSGEKFDVVSLDPPAFVKRKKDLEAGLGAYHKINKLAARVLSPGGFILTASCSQNLEAWQFARIAGQALYGRKRPQLIVRGGQGPDHPVHPAMPETDYLKSLLFRLNSSQYEETA